MRETPRIITGGGPIRALVVDHHWNATHHWRQVLWGVPALDRAYCVHTLPEARHWLASRLGFNLLVVEEEIASLTSSNEGRPALARFLTAAIGHGVCRVALVLPEPTAEAHRPRRLSTVTDYVYPAQVIGEIPRLVTNMAA